MIRLGHTKNWQQRESTEGGIMNEVIERHYNKKKGD